MALPAQRSFVTDVRGSEGLGRPAAQSQSPRVANLSAPIRRPPDLSGFAEPEPTPSRPAWAILADRIGPDGEPQTTILGAVRAYGVSYATVHRAFVWGLPPKAPVGHPGDWSIMWASHSDLRAIFGPAQVEPEPLAANKASLRERISRLQREAGHG